MLQANHEVVGRLLGVRALEVRGRRRPALGEVPTDSSVNPRSAGVDDEGSPPDLHADELVADGALHGAARTRAGTFAPAARPAAAARVRRAPGPGFDDEDDSPPALIPVPSNDGVAACQRGHHGRAQRALNLTPRRAHGGCLTS